MLHRRFCVESGTTKVACPRLGMSVLTSFVAQKNNWKLTSKAVFIHLTISGQCWLHRQFSSSSFGETKYLSRTIKRFWSGSIPEVKEVTKWMKQLLQMLEQVIIKLTNKLKSWCREKEMKMNIWQWSFTLPQRWGPNQWPLQIFYTEEISGW